MYCMPAPVKLTLKVKSPVVSTGATPIRSPPTISCTSVLGSPWPVITNGSPTTSCADESVHWGGMNVLVAVGVAVGVLVGVCVAVDVLVGSGVSVTVGVSVIVGVAVDTGVAVSVAVGVSVTVAVLVAVGVAVAVAVLVAVGVSVGVAVLVTVGVSVGVAVAVGSSTKTYPATPPGIGSPRASTPWQAIYCNPAPTNCTLKVKWPSASVATTPKTAPPIRICT